MLPQHPVGNCVGKYYYKSYFINDDFNFSYFILYLFFIFFIFYFLYLYLLNIIIGLTTSEPI